MATRARTALALAAAFIALPAAAPAEDLTIVSTVSTPRGGPRTQTHFISSTRIRTSDQDRDIIVDVASGQVTLVDNRRKEYSQTSLEEVAAFIRQVDAALAASAALEDALGPPAAVIVQKGKSRRTIAGYDTEHYTIAMGDAVRFEVWAAPALPAPVPFFHARRVYYATIGPMGTRFVRVLDEMRKIPGFPLGLTVRYRMRMAPRQVTTEAHEVRQGPVPESTFSVPPGYKRVESRFGRRS
jgi:hypothetical protein